MLREGGRAHIEEYGTGDDVKRRETVTVIPPPQFLTEEVNRHHVRGFWFAGPATDAIEAPSGHPTFGRHKIPELMDLSKVYTCDSYVLRP